MVQDAAILDRIPTARSAEMVRRATKTSVMDLIASQPPCSGCWTRMPCQGSHKNRSLLLSIKQKHQPKPTSSSSATPVSNFHTSSSCQVWRMGAPRMCRLSALICDHQCQSLDQVLILKVFKSANLTVGICPTKRLLKCERSPASD